MKEKSLTPKDLQNALEKNHKEMCGRRFSAGDTVMIWRRSEWKEATLLGNRHGRLTVAPHGSRLAAHFAVDSPDIWKKGLFLKLKAEIENAQNALAWQPQSSTSKTPADIR